MPNRCAGCGQAGADLGPMLHDYIWRQIAKPGEHTLCAKCMLERTTERLGRMPTFATCGRAPGICFTGRIRGSTYVGVIAEL
jgi:hypothetical protein